MAKRKLSKSSRDGMLNTFIEARCACGGCGCTMCGSCGDSGAGASKQAAGLSDSHQILTSFVSALG